MWGQCPGAGTTLRPGRGRPAQAGLAPAGGAGRLAAPAAVTRAQLSLGRPASGQGSLSRQTRPAGTARHGPALLATGTARHGTPRRPLPAAPAPCRPPPPRPAPFDPAAVPALPVPNHVGAAGTAGQRRRRRHGGRRGGGRGAVPQLRGVQLPAAAAGAVHAQRAAAEDPQDPRQGGGPRPPR